MPTQHLHINLGAFTEVFWGFLGLYDRETGTLSYYGSDQQKLDVTTYDTAVSRPGWLADRWEGSEGGYGGCTLRASATLSNAAGWLGALCRPQPVAEALVYRPG